jgi:hypothetical protein
MRHKPDHPRTWPELCEGRPQRRRSSAHVQAEGIANPEEADAEDLEPLFTTFRNNPLAGP